SWVGIVLSASALGVFRFQCRSDKRSDQQHRDCMSRKSKRVLVIREIDRSTMDCCRMRPSRFFGSGPVRAVVVHQIDRRKHYQQRYYAENNGGALQPLLLVWTICRHTLPGITVALDSFERPLNILHRVSQNYRAA